MKTSYEKLTAQKDFLSLKILVYTNFKPIHQDQKLKKNSATSILLFDTMKQYAKFDK